MKRKAWIALGIMVVVPVGFLVLSDFTSNKSEFSGNVIQSSINSYLLSRDIPDSISVVIIDTVLSLLPTSINKSIVRARMRSIGINNAGAAFGSRSTESALRNTRSDTALVNVMVKTTPIRTTVFLEYSCGSLCGESFAYTYLNLFGQPLLIHKQFAAVM
jgi:uncharacterized membrane protein